MLTLGNNSATDSITSIVNKMNPTAKEHILRIFLEIKEKRKISLLSKKYLIRIINKVPLN